MFFTKTKRNKCLRLKKKSRGIKVLTRYTTHGLHPHLARIGQAAGVCSLVERDTKTDDGIGEPSARTWREYRRCTNLPMCKPYQGNGDKG